MAGSSGISRDDWLKAVQDVQVPVVDDRGAMTTHEFGAMMGCSINVAQRKIKGLFALGRVRQTTKFITRTDGSRLPVSAYLPVKV